MLETNYSFKGNYQGGMFWFNSLHFYDCFPPSQVHMHVLVHPAFQLVWCISLWYLQNVVHVLQFFEASLQLLPLVYNIVFDVIHFFGPERITSFSMLYRIVAFLYNIVFDVIQIQGPKRITSFPMLYRIVAFLYNIVFDVIHFDSAHVILSFLFSPATKKST